MPASRRSQAFPCLHLPSDWLRYQSTLTVPAGGYTASVAGPSRSGPATTSITFSCSSLSSCAPSGMLKFWRRCRVPFFQAMIPFHPVAKSIDWSCSSPITGDAETKRVASDSSRLCQRLHASVHATFLASRADSSPSPAAIAKSVVTCRSWWAFACRITFHNPASEHTASSPS